MKRHFILTATACCFLALGTAQELPELPKAEPPTFAVKGYVYDSDTLKPVSGALVELLVTPPEGRGKGADNPSQSSVVTATSTDIDGLFVLLGLPFPLSPAILRIRHSEYDGTEVQVTNPAREFKVSVLLHPIDAKAFNQSKPVKQLIFFCTDRQPTKSTKPRDRFGPDRGTNVQCGSAEAEMPTRSLTTKVKAGSFTKTATVALDSRLSRVDVLTDTEFLKRVRAETSAHSDLLVFVHGYKNTFDEAARRLAELAYHLKFPGPVVLYSWPSQGRLLGYWADEATIRLTNGHFRTFLQLMREQTGAKNVHLLAHSMGNRTVNDVLGTWKGKAFGQVVMAAADIDRDTLQQEAPQLAKSAARVTLYGSDHDQAIRLSMWLHWFRRAGEGGNHIAVAKGMDSVDASALRTDILGHDYFINPQTILRDIQAVLRGESPPRQNLVKRQHPNGEVWLYRP